MKIVAIARNNDDCLMLFKHVAEYDRGKIATAKKSTKWIALTNGDEIEFKNINSRCLDGIKADVAVGYMTDCRELELITCASKEAKRVWCLTDLELYIDAL